MPRKLVGGLIQAAAPLADPSVPIDKIRKAAIDAHIPLIEEAGPSQDAHWYDIAEAVSGPTTELMAQYDRHVPEGARLLGLNGAEIVFNPSATVAGRVWPFYRARRPETHGSMAEQLP